MNGVSSYGKPVFGFFILIGLSVVLGAVVPQDCDKSKCNGPIRYYEDLNCKPVYEKEGDCCAVRYNCTHLDGRATDKCYANGKEYKIGDQLAKEDRSSPCDIACTCIKGYQDEATFVCAAVDCFTPPPKEGCYMKRDLDTCCGGEEVCPKSNDNIVKCEFNGMTYMDGQQFYPSDDLICLCSEGYKGENVEPFCKKIGCGIELRHSREIRDNCSPVFYSSQTPSTSCSYAYRCQNDNDTVVRMANVKSPTEAMEVPDDMKCKFGNMTMRIGDTVSPSTDRSSSNEECVCEVPPTPTCRHLPDDVSYDQVEQTTIPQ